MSMITPLLDTLLHNVLGRRADLDRVASRQPDLPLGGVTYTPAVRHGTSDTPDETLQRQSDDASARARAAGKTASRVTVSSDHPAPENREVSSASRSSTTHFSAEARAISRILERFPATAPVINTNTVMLPTGRTPEAAGLAATLAGQIRHSGLFYESHLRQWLLGQFDQQALLKEPQNRLFQPPAPGNRGSADASHGVRAAAISERVSMVSGNGTSSQDSGMTLSSVQDDLQGILRHQLELMTYPLIRWEGFLTPQVPVQWEIEQAPDEADSEGEEEVARVWRSRLKLTLPELGHVDLEINLQDSTINVSGSVEAPWLAWMTVQGRHLDERLAGAGLQLTALHFSPRSHNDHEEGTA
ncbi:flagellar hook-length control protein FliK [Kushneria sp. AK178]